MWPRFGIKIGNSTVCIAAAKDDGKIEVIANKQGDRVSDACLIWQDNEIEVGITAKQKMPSKLSETIANSFQLFENNLTDEQELHAIKYIPCNYNKETKKFDLISQGNEKPHCSLSPYEVCVEFFKASFELARQYNLGEVHPSVVLSIPDYYSYDCWKNLSKAAEESGFHVAQIITEPTAAVLAYELGENTNLYNNNNINNGIINNNNDQDDQSKIVLSIKSGGICSSFTLFEIKNGLYTVIDTAGPFYIGGKQITDCIIEFIKKEFYKKYRLDSNESRRTIGKIRTAADNCKHILTTLQSTHIYIDSLMDGIDFNIQMSRARFENLIQPVLNDFLTILNTSLETINKSNKNIDEIVLAGATLKIPKIQSMISQRFPNANLNIKFPTDEVVAIGCARQSIFLLNPTEQDLNIDTKLSIIDSNIYIWYNNNNKLNDHKKILLFKKGMIIPSLVKFDIEINIDEDVNKTLNNNCNGNDNDNSIINKHKEFIFNVETNDVINQIKLIDAELPHNNILRIEADIKLNYGDHYPSITLRSI